MKKNAKRLLAMTLATYMCLMMTTGIATAKIERTMVSNGEINVNDSLDSNMTIASNNPQGMIITYNGNGYTYTDTHNVDDSGNVYARLIPNDLPGTSWQGYLFKWNVTSITDGTVSADQSPDSLTLTLNSADLIHYTIQYYDGNSLIHTQKNVTAESNSFFHDGHDLKKDGYTFSHWTNESGKDILRPGDSVDMLYLSSHEVEDTYVSDTAYTIKLYAAWEEIQMDDSPAAGDNMPVGILMLLMTAFAAGAVSVISCKKRSA